MANTQIKKHPLFDHYGADEYGNIYSFKFKKIKLKLQSPHGRGYLHFTAIQNGNKKSYLSHRFVYECYTGKLIDAGLQCHHIDHDKHNNHIDNLEVVDQWMNMHYGKEAGVLYGTANPNHPFYNR